MCETCEWAEYKDRAEWMLNDERYAFAYDTISGIRDWIIGHEHVTERQKTALENIERSVAEREDN